uniref:Uncharacterized protein n=1 Tax=Octopus bimaculoides TaxID=37653 RepID=A0A0L8GBK5_OCTBM
MIHLPIINSSIHFLVQVLTSDKTCSLHKNDTSNVIGIQLINSVIYDYTISNCCQFMQFHNGIKLLKFSAVFF